MLFIRIILLMSLTLGASGILTAKNIPAEVLALQKNQSLENLDRYVEHLESRRNQLYQNFYRYYTDIKKKSDKKARKKSLKKKIVIVYDYLIKRVKEAKKILDKSVLKRELEVIFEIDNALKSSGRMLIERRFPKYIKQAFKTWSVDKDSTHDVEAENLVNPETGDIIASSDVAELKDSGLDFSKLNPSLKSPFWQDPSEIRKNYSVNDFTSGVSPSVQGLDIWFPEHEADFVRVKKSQTKPKLIVEAISTSGEKSEFKFKTGGEIHSEITASSLLTYLGYSTDVTKYVKNFRVNLGETSPEEVKKELKSYYTKSYLSGDVESLIVDEGQDEKGYYIILSNGHLEAKPKELLRVGPWEYGASINKGSREVRGLALFNIWVANADLKEGDNNKLIFRKSGKGDYKIFKIQHDNGYAFGHFYRETVDNYRWDVLEEKAKKIEFKFSQFQINTGFNHVTYADYKWMARLIGGLSREQIEGSVKLGGWPKPVERLLVEKLIYRRNQIVKAFDLVGEVLGDGHTIKMMKADRHLTLSDGSIVDGKLTTDIYKGFSTQFGHEFKQLIRPMVRALKLASKDLASKAISAALSIDYAPIELGLQEDREYFAGVLVKVNRTIEKNLAPKGGNDTFLVKDEMMLGVRLGTGYVASGSISYMKKFTIIYPAPSKKAAQQHYTKLVDYLLPFHIWKSKLPRKHIVIVEDYLEGQGRLRAESSQVTIGTEVTLGRVYLNRIILNAKNEKSVQISLDNSIYNEFTAKVNARAFVLRIPIAELIGKAGELSRFQYEISKDNYYNSPLLKKKLTSIINLSEYSSLLDSPAVKVIDSKFKQSFFNINLLGLIHLKKKSRLDELKILEKDQESNKYQFMTSIDSGWSFLTNGENVINKIYYVAHKSRFSENFNDCSIHMQFEIKDKNVKTYELKSYLNFVNVISGNDKFIDFTPQNHTSTNLWSKLNFTVNLNYSSEMVRDLLSLPIKKLKIKIANNLDMTYRELDSHFNGSYRILGGEDLSDKEKDLYDQLERFFYHLSKAQKSKKLDKKLKHLMKSLRVAMWKDGQSYSTVIFSSIHEMVGYDHFFLSGLIAPPKNVENILPGGKPLYSQMGEYQAMTLEVLSLGIYNISELYKYL